MKAPKVVHCKKEPYDQYIGRPSKWGNPFPITVGMSRGATIDHYRRYLLGRRDLLESIYELDGLVLGCWCKPFPCHGDVLVEVFSILYLDETDNPFCSRGPMCLNDGSTNCRKAINFTLLGYNDMSSPTPQDPWTHCEDEVYMF